METTCKGFEVIPGFSKYLINKDGEVINAKMGNPVMRKSDNPEQVQCFSDKGTRDRFNVAEMVKTVFPATVAAAKPKPATNDSVKSGITKAVIKGRNGKQKTFNNPTDLTKEVDQHFGKPNPSEIAKKHKKKLQVKEHNKKLLDKILKPGIIAPEKVAGLLNSEASTPVKIYALVGIGQTYKAAGANFGLNENQVKGYMNRVKNNTDNKAAGEALVKKFK